MSDLETPGSSEVRRAARSGGTAILVTRVDEWRKAGIKVHCVYETGPTGFWLAHQLLTLCATCLVVYRKRLDRQRSDTDRQQLARRSEGAETSCLLPHRTPCLLYRVWLGS